MRKTRKTKTMTQATRLEEEREKRISATALEIPPMIRMQTTKQVARSLAMCIDRFDVPYRSVKGSEIGTIEHVNLNGMNCAAITYPGHRSGKGMEFLIIPSGQVLMRAHRDGLGKMPIFVDPEVAFGEDQEKAFQELTNGQVPKDE